MAVKIGAATLYRGDCLEVLPTLDPVHAIVTDPPYHLLQAARGGSPRQNDRATPFGRTGSSATPCGMGRGCGRTEPDPCSGSCDADVLRAPEIQHSVQHVGRDGDLGRLSP